MIRSVESLGSIGHTDVPAVTAGKPANDPRTAGDTVTLSERGREYSAARKTAQENRQIREALVQEMKKRLEQDPFIAGRVADIIADKLVNGWRAVGQT